MTLSVSDLEGPLPKEESSFHTVTERSCRFICGHFKSTGEPLHHSRKERAPWSGNNAPTKYQDFQYNSGRTECVLKPEILDNSIIIPFERSYTLGRNVPAIQILSTDSEQRSRLGLMTQLPEGTRVDIGGRGFDEHTVRIRCAGSSYYVFIEDLEPQRKRAASATAS